jgi:hypothetical protein
MTTPANLEPLVVRLVREFRARLLVLDSAAARALIQAYLPVWQKISSDLTSLLHEAVDRQLSGAQTLRLARLQALQRQMADEVAKFTEFAGPRISQAQAQATTLARDSVRKTVDAALPPGIDTQVLARARIQWVQLPNEAFANFVGASGSGSPLANLLDEIGPTVRAGVNQSIAEGIALGQSPRDTALLVQRRVGMGLTRSLTISRTETLRSYREASRLQYHANRDIVKGFKRVSAQDSNVCMACLALDNMTYKTSVALDEHVNGRCAIVPITIGYKDLGIDVEEPDFSRTTSRDWFNTQPESVQRDMMGPGRFEGWKSGEFELTDMAKVEHSAVWGAQAVVKPVKELV